jgi:hypothetical protein
MAVEGEVTEQAHDVVCGHDEAEGGFRGPEVLETEGVESEVLLEFADPVLTIGPGMGMSLRALKVTDGWRLIRSLVGWSQGLGESPLRCQWSGGRLLRSRSTA